MGKHSEVFVAFDVAKKKHAMAIAEGGRIGEVRFLGDVENSPLPIERTIRRLAQRSDHLHVCFEAGPTGYGLHRQVKALGHDCMVVAPALIPKRAGERVKTNRRDAVTLARLHRAGELTGVWAPDAAHRWNGSIGQDRDGNIALGYSVSSSTVFPAIRYAGRLAGDPLGTLAQGETSLIECGGSQTRSNRWGYGKTGPVQPLQQHRQLGRRQANRPVADRGPSAYGPDLASMFVLAPCHSLPALDQIGQRGRRQTCAFQNRQGVFTDAVAAACG